MTFVLIVTTRSNIELGSKTHDQSRVPVENDPLFFFR